MLFMLCRYRLFAASLTGLHHSYLPVSGPLASSELLAQVHLHLHLHLHLNLHLHLHLHLHLQWRELQQFGCGGNYSLGRREGGVLVDSVGEEGGRLVINRGIGEVEEVEEESEEDGMVEVHYPMVGGGVVRAVVGWRDSLEAESVEGEEEVEGGEGGATWLGRPWGEALARRGLTLDQVTALGWTGLAYPRPQAAPPLRSEGLCW